MTMSKRGVIFQLVILLILTWSTAVGAAPDQGIQGMGWGRVGIGYWYPDLQGLNKVLEGHGEFTTPLAIGIGGGEGGIVPGFSFGGFGGGGTVTEDNARLSAGFGGFSFNRTFPLKGGYWYCGGLLGGGGAELLITKTPSVPIGTVGDAVSQSPHTYLTTNFFLIGPQLGVQFPITPIIQLQASAGYLFTVGGNWRLAGSQELAGGQVNWNGPVFTIGVTFGGSGVIPEPEEADAISI